MIKGEFQDEGVTPRPAARPPVRAAIDEVSKRIIEILQADGRRDFADIALALNLEENAVEQRVLTLVDSGVITFTTVSDPLQLGFACQAMLGIHVEKGGAAAVAARLAKIPEIAYMVLTAGDFELLAEVVATSDEHLSELISTTVGGTPGITAVETFICEAVEKDTYTWVVL